MAIIGQPDVAKERLDNAVTVPRALSFLTYKAWTAQVYGLDHFPRQEWPDQIELLYFSYHIMVGLGTIFIAILLLSAWLLFRGTLFTFRPMLWALMLALPFPFIANTAGWITAEVGRQPWLIYGLMRTSAGFSPLVSGRQRLVHATRVLRYVRNSGDPVSIFGVSRDRARTRTGPGERPGCARRCFELRGRKLPWPQSGSAWWHSCWRVT